MREDLKKVVIIDYQLGNLYSVKQACDTVGMNAAISTNKKDILDADALILPGVGAFIQAMENLEKLDLIDAIKTKINSGTPLFGICLGLQLLFTKSEEFGSGNGLNLIPGIIKKFPEKFNNRKIKVPHITWNQVSKYNEKWEGTPLNDLKDNEFMYFIHSYYVVPNNNEHILTNTNYDEIEFCSSVIHENIFATQFHPEKSADKGLSIYKNWALTNKLI
jgi:imidazole glycerol-phosphate synthase subunit HisH